MKRCFILCNIQNPKSNYIVSGFAGSNVSLYLGRLMSFFSEVVFVNVGAPNQAWKLKQKNKEYKCEEGTIVEFPYGPSFFPTRIKAKLMIRNAIKYIISNRQPKDFLLIYHSISFSFYYQLLINRFGINNVVIHVAELYSEVGNICYSIKREIKKLRVFEKYIFMSCGIKDRIVKDNKKKYMYLYGVYKTGQLIEKVGDDNNNVNLVYAGTASKIKGGLFSALSALQYLPKNIKLHVFCSADSSLIKKINNSGAIYEGYADEKTLNAFMCSCHIGLATQNPNLPFNNSSFPSKIVNYLACGLNVVSSKSISVTKSPFKDYVYFYEEDSTGNNLAKAILKSSILINKEKNIQFIEKLDNEAKLQIRRLFEGQL